MRFYKLKLLMVNLNDLNQPIPKIEWFPSEREAAIHRLELFKDDRLWGAKSAHVITAWDVPTEKPGLLRFLKENCLT